ncbi:MAG TPA: hypothetical protein VG125_01085 [Pirellulales bacterium]|jgi:hypothetical protein|nr:hypothetical protein [Pirellulales bacterium]
MTKPEWRKHQTQVGVGSAIDRSSFRLRHSFVIRHSGFVIERLRH